MAPKVQVGTILIEERPLVHQRRCRENNLPSRTLTTMLGEVLPAMRSDRIHKALANIPNRFVLCRLVSVATREFLGPDRRVQDVINDVIGRFADTEFATQQLRILADLETKLPAA